MFIGSCWAFSAVGAIEGAHALATGNLVSLSEQQLVSCVTTNHGCRGGAVTRAYEYVVRNGGITSSTNYPYTATNGTCQPDQVRVIDLPCSLLKQKLYHFWSLI